MFLCRRCKGKLLALQRNYSGNATGRDYNAAVAALNGLQSNFSIVEALRKRGPGYNTQAIPEMINWLQTIGYEPHDLNRLNAIHIAGTKGKGSTSSFVSSILTQYLPTEHSINAERLPSQVGLYTSPHLRFVRERIQVDNQPISEDQFAQCFWEIWDRLESPKTASVSTESHTIDNKPVYFRYLTLMGLHCFMKQSIGTAVIECGIGGEYDSTNIIPQPSVTAVTNLGIDHEALLGNTIDSIAWHKAGIFKSGVPAFTVQQPEKAMAVLQDRARERGTQVHVVPRHSAVNSIQLGLQGDFQTLNASLAVAVSASHLSRLGFSGMPDPLDPDAELPTEFVKGLETTRLGGRCEKRADQVHNGLTWYIDGGHTLESIEVAGRWFARQTADSKDQGGIRVLVFNQQTRDASSLAKHLHETLASAFDDGRPFQHVIFTPNTTYKDAGYASDLVSINTSQDDVTSLRVQKELARTWNIIDSAALVHVVASIEEATAHVRRIAEENTTEVLVTGSLHLVGGVIQVLEHQSERMKT